MTVRKIDAWGATLLILAFAAIPCAVNAQVVGGGGGVFSGVLNYLTGSVVNDITSLAILGLGVMMLAFRFSLMTIATVCVGLWVVLNPSVVKSWF